MRRNFKQYLSYLNFSVNWIDYKMGIKYQHYLRMKSAGVLGDASLIFLDMDEIEPRVFPTARAFLHGASV